MVSAVSSNEWLLVGNILRTRSPQLHAQGAGWWHALCASFQAEVATLGNAFRSLLHSWPASCSEPIRHSCVDSGTIVAASVSMLRIGLAQGPSRKLTGHVEHGTRFRVVESHHCSLHGARQERCQTEANLNIGGACPRHRDNESLFEEPRVPSSSSLV